MPERSFGRTVRYRRTRLGLSQAKLAELVGRSTPTIRSWERDKSRPNDPEVLATLATILGIDERQLFDKAQVDRPEISAETSSTVEQALATLSMGDGPGHDGDPEPGTSTAAPTPVSVQEYTIDLVEMNDGGEDVARAMQLERHLVGVSNTVGELPAFAAPPDPYLQTPLTPTVADLSYIEDNSQRQVYRVRSLATLVAVIALVVALIWALGEGLGALGDWWDSFYGNLRL